MRNTQHFQRSSKANESGFVSIIVTMTIMIILSLISISFAKIMQREARQALDRQLSTQAFYAAESGVNDAIEVLKTSPGTAKTECGNPTTGPFSSLNPSLDNATVDYSCLLVDSNPGSLVFDSVDINKSTVTKFMDSAGGNINKISFAWQSSDPTYLNNFHNDAQHKLPASTGPGSWGTDTGIVRVSIYPIPLVVGVPVPGNRAQMNANARTYFLYPQSGAAGAVATASWADATQNGAIIDGNCNAAKAPRRCAATITNLPNGYMYYLRIKSVYNTVTAEISAQDNSGATRYLAGAQTKIDSTGKTSDVYRRIQVRVPLQSYPEVPEYAIETAGDICKRITIAGAFMSDECDPLADVNCCGVIVLPPPSVP